MGLISRPRTLHSFFYAGSPCGPIGPGPRVYGGLAHNGSTPEKEKKTRKKKQGKRKSIVVVVVVLVKDNVIMHDLSHELLLY